MNTSFLDILVAIIAWTAFLYILKELRVFGKKSGAVYKAFRASNQTKKSPTVKKPQKRRVALTLAKDDWKLAESLAGARVDAYLSNIITESLKTVRQSASAQELSKSLKEKRKKVRDYLDGELFL